MSAHTPGPWTVDPADTDEFGLYRVREVDPARYHQGQDGANARLIAAAPDLLAAAQRAHHWFECECSPGHEDWHAAFAILEQLRAAIARLLAAAPDLLAACRALLDELDLRGERSDKRYTPATLDAAIKLGDAAVAAATVRSSS